MRMDKGMRVLLEYSKQKIVIDLIYMVAVSIRRASWAY